MTYPTKTLPPAQCLIAFEAAARHLSFTRAARELGMTQPAISHQVRRLERHLGVALFRRLYRGVALTPEGQQLFEAVQKGFALVSETVVRIRGPQRHGRINVGTDFGFAAFWLLPRLPAFRALHPNIDVRIVTAQKAFDLRADPVDVAVVFGGSPHRHGAARLLFAEEAFPVCSPRWLAERPALRTAEDLLAQPLLHLDDEGEDRWFNWRTWLREAGLDSAPPDPRLSFDNYTLLIQAAIAGQGVALGWAFLVDHLIERGLLASALRLSFASSRGYFVLLPADRAPRPEALAFRDWLFSEQAGAPPRCPRRVADVGADLV